MNYSHRDEREQQLLAILLLIFEEQRKTPNRANLHVTLYEKLGPVLAEIYFEAAEELGQVFPMNREKISRQALAWAAQQAAELSQQIADRSDELLRAAAEGDKAVEDALATIFGEGRAEGIAITEVTKAATAGMEQVAAGELLEGDEKPEATWRTQEDADVCLICQPLDGTRRSFWSSRVPKGPGHAHPRCRCYLDYKEAA